MAVAADEGTVKANFRHFECRHGAELRRKEVLLGNPVGIVEKTQHSKLHPVFSVVRIGDAADEDIEPFARNPLGHGFLHLVGGKVRKQIRDDEAGLSCPATESDFNGFTAFQHHNAVELQRDRHPLILLDPAVIVGFEIGKFVALIERVLLEVNAGAVDMGAGYHCTVCKALLPDHCKDQRFAAVAEVDFLPRLQGHARLIGDEAVLLRLGNRVGDCLPLGAGAVKISHVVGSVVLHQRMFLRCNKVVAVFLLIKQICPDVFHPVSVPP